MPNFFQKNYFVMVKKVLNNWRGQSFRELKVSLFQVYHFRTAGCQIYNAIRKFTNSFL